MTAAGWIARMERVVQVELSRLEDEAADTDVSWRAEWGAAGSKRASDARPYAEPGPSPRNLDDRGTRLRVVVPIAVCSRRSRV
jgi:hypothetical protein